MIVPYDHYLVRFVMQRSSLFLVICLCIYTSLCQAQNATPVYFKTWEAMGAEKSVGGLSLGEDQNLYGYIDRSIYRYDGNRWIQIIETERTRMAYFASKKGLYIAKLGEANWHKPNPNGTFDTIDLSSEASKKDLVPVIIQGTKEAVYFMGTGGVFAKKHSQREGKLEQVWKTNTVASCEAPDAFYIVDDTNQLVKIQRDKAQTLVDIAKKMPQISPILFLQCSANGSLLMKSVTHQFLRYSSATGLQPFSIEGFAPNVAVKWYRSLASGSYVFLLGDSQIVMTDENGKVLQKWSQTDLKLNAPPSNIMPDKQDRVWFTNSEGMGYIDVRSRFEAPIQTETVPSVGIVQKTLQDEANSYIISSENILHRKHSEAWNAPFQPIYTSSKAVIGDAAKGANNLLWVCDVRQLVLLQHEVKAALPPNLPCKAVATLRIAPDRVWVGDEDGLRMMDKQGKVLSTQNIAVNDLYALSQDELLVQESKDKTDRFTKLKFDTNGNVVSTTRYPEFALKFLSIDRIFKYNGKIFIFDKDYIYRFERNNWVIATEIWQPNPTITLNAILPTSDGKLWLVAADRTGYFTVENGQYNWHGLPYRLDKRNGASMLFALPDGSVMMRSNLGVAARILPEATKKPQAPLAVEISSVLNRVSGETLLLGIKADLPASWTFKTDVRDLLFTFGHGEGEDAGIAYQTWLEGEESEWSVWSKESVRQYSNLSGSYTLHVRMRDSYGRTAETTFPFYVSPPWYVRWWALALWALLLGFGGYVGFQYAVRYRTQQFEARNRELEAKVAERTQVIARQTEELRSLDQAKTLFFGNVSHEFRTPLTLLLGWVQRLNKERPNLDSAEGNEALFQMHAQVKNLQGLIDQIMDLTKIEAGRFELNKEPLDMTTFVKRFAGTFQSLADYKQLKLVVETPHEPIPVLASMKALEQILGNVLNNAIKFTEANSEIKVHLTKNMDKTISLTVTDTGFGISPMDLPYIFERYYQAKDDRNKQEGGTGIGLALASDLAKLHDGTLSATSELGKGSTFTLVLPILENAPEMLATPILETLESRLPMLASSSVVQQPSADEDRARLLIIEDQPDLRVFIRQMFEAEYVVFEAENGQIGLEMAKSVLPDLVLCDVMMPKMNGFEVAEALQQNSETRGVPFVFLTARASDEDMMRGLSLGAVDYILKPFDTEALKLKVRNLLDVVRRESLSKAPKIAATQAKVEAPTEMPFQIHVREFVMANLSNPDLAMDDIAESLNLGRSVFYQQFKEGFGISPLAYLRNKRLEVAAERLKQGDLTVSEVAYQTGFNSVAYFTKNFREHYGKSPTGFMSDKL